MADGSRDEQAVQALVLDHAFASAVRAGDVRSAAHCSWRFFQQQQQQRGGVERLALTPGKWPDGDEDDFGLLDDPAWAADLPAMTPAVAVARTPGGSRRRGGSDASGWQPKSGDWVVIQGIKTHSSDADLVGHHAQVLSVDGQGMVELSISKLGMTARLHRKHVAPLHMGVAQGPPRAAGSFSSGGTMTEDPPQQHHHHRHHHHGHHHHSHHHNPQDSSGGGAPTPGVYTRPATLGQPLPPARVSLAPGKGVGKSREVARQVRRELIALEEGVPWECVEAGWKVRRSTWQRALRNMETGKAPDVVVPAMSAAIHELHEALLTDKSGATPATATLVRGGVWEARLHELAAGGNNCQCLLRVWEELHDGIRSWLYAQGRGPSLLASPQQALNHAAAAMHPPPAQPTGLGMGKGAGGGSLVLPPTPMGPMPPTPSGGSAGGGGGGVGASGSRVFDKGAYSLALRAVQAIQQGVAATDMYLALGQLAVDRVMALGREASANLRALLAAADEVSLGPALEALAGACDLPALLGVTPGELDKLTDADVVCLMLVSPAVRAELRLLHGVDSEPETEVDAGGDMTDMELSD